MCGIFGAIRKEGSFEAGMAKEFVSLSRLVDYRGPDAFGSRTFSVKNKTVKADGSFDVFLGHNRLAIIDLSSAGNQPLTDDGTAWIVYNGEIFNYVELRAQLTQKGHVFKTKTDTEVILKIYREYGSSGFEKLNGMWSFALLDLAKQQMVLSRDRFSIKPLFYLDQGGYFYFASEIKQLLPLLKAKEVNPASLYVFFNQGISDHNEETFFKEIKRVRPKHNFIVSLVNGKGHEEQYWDYQKVQGSMSLDDAVTGFRDLFFDSVNIRLRSDVKIGGLLSGGLDSSAIAVVAQDLSRGNFETFSVISEDKRYSEEKFIDILNKKKSIKTNKLVMQSSHPWEYLQKVLHHHDEPFGSMSVVAQYMIMEKIKQETDIRVLLSGQGGDEVLMGYLKFFFFYCKDLMRKKDFIKAASEIASALVHRTIFHQFKMSTAKRYMPFFMNKNKMPFLRIKGFSEPTMVFNNLRERQIADIDTYSIPVLARYEDRNSMAHSLESRLPFLDHRLVDFSLNLSDSLKIRGGWTKYILRQAMSELPDPIRWRKDKQGFITAEESWLRGDLVMAIEEVFKKSVLNEMGILDSKLFLQYYADFRDRRGIISHADISRVFIAEMWVRKMFGKETLV